MRAKTNSSSGTVMNLISVLATKLKSMVLKKPLKTTLIVKKVNQNPTTNMKLYNEIISRLCKYIDGAITLKQFSEWFVPAVWTTDPKDIALNRLIYSIKIRFAEYSNEHWTVAELRERLIDLIL